ncbi:hypothetical protein A9308_06065 [Moraxella atlantae]|uniref:Uncharacterized protein n=1 Tax=Faucicola atlantae TaxID=34059 RepID=A0A1B8QCQ2_9GAMM|nr:hypothetical protein [Moraxella atlantae]OBX79085.1 hypothetical protein A9308_06065 [Moraxella atlantae]
MPTFIYSVDPITDLKQPQNKRLPSPRPTKQPNIKESHVNFASLMLIFVSTVRELADKRILVKGKSKWL